MTLTEETDLQILEVKISKLEEDILTQERRVKHFEKFAKESGVFISSFYEVEKRFLSYLKMEKNSLIQKIKVLLDKKNEEKREAKND